MNKQKRTQCVITGNGKIAKLHSFKDFPISMSTVTDLDISKDVFSDMEWGVSEDNHVQLMSLLDPDLIYKNYHSPGTVGKIWKEHHQLFAEFIQQDKFDQVLEIGGASGTLVNNFLDLNQDFNWMIVEPGTPTPFKDNRIAFTNGYFENHNFDRKFDVIVHSHVFEHVYDPITFLNKANDLLDYGGVHYISIPNMKYWLDNNFMNTLSFEHTFYLDADVARYLLSKTGFEVVEECINDHSVFIKSVKSKNVKEVNIDFSYIPKLFENYVENLKTDVNDINQKVQGKPFYLFGGHIFSQYLLTQGLTDCEIICILDNDLKKQNKRLYGTSCIVKSPECLKNIINPIVVLRGGSYHDEIKESILKINPTIIFV